MKTPTEERLFAAALARPASERAAFLDGACHGDPALRRRIEELLAAHHGPDPFLEPQVAPPDGATVLAPPEEGPGTLIGRYKILEKIGEGGFGVVYVAEQREPVKRRVALKIIKLGMDTKQVVARFEAERQALAMMDHPNIAKVLDAGATDSGRPYFVMELVRGIPITQHCDQNNLPTEKRLKLFIQVCQAIQHAHQKGIIHRDIKPSNILVTVQDADRSAVPKVIDFGIAKATQQQLTEKTVYTQLQQFIGTPAYMSPEQAEMSAQDIDTRSDIYSLGVLLYELLVGRTPFDAGELLKSGLEAMRRTIREKEPLRPSTRLGTMPEEERTTAAKQRAAEAGKLMSLLRGDLDWIVMKCLEKDRTLRYDTANGLAMDVERFQRSEPVVARPPSAAYRVQKFVRRNRVMVTAAATVGVVLVLGAFVSTWQAIRATQAKQQAEVNERKAQTAQANEAQQRQRAEAEAYGADINLAQQALRDDDLGKARTLLARYRPGSGREQLRGFEWRCLAAEAQGDYAAADTSSTDCVHCLALSPDGRMVAVSRMWGNIELWDPASLKRIATLETNLVGGVAFSPTGGLLAASVPRGGVRLWQLEPLRIVAELAHSDAPTRLSFSPDGRHLASFQPESGVCVWDLESRQTVRRYLGFLFKGGDIHGGPICFSPDGGRLAVGDGTGRIRILDWAGDRVVVDFPAHAQVITSLAYSPDGKLLASGSAYSPDDIRLWNPATGQSAGSLAGHRGWISVLQFFDNGRRLLSGSADQTIGIWDVPARHLTLKLRGHLDEVWSLAFDERRTNLISGSKDGTLARWDIDKVQPHALRLDLAGQLQSPGYAASGSTVAVLDAHGAVALWHPGDRQQLSVIAALGTNNAALATACGRGLLACATRDGAVRVWSLQSANLVTNLAEFDGQVSGLRFSRGDDFLLAFDWSGAATIWDAKTWTKRASFTEKNRVARAALSPDGRLLVPLSGMDLNEYQQRAALSPDGRLLVLGLGDRRLEWWDAVRGQRLGENHLSAHGISSLDFSPDGSTLASASQDGWVALWDTTTRRRTAYWKADAKGVQAVAFSPDGARLATGAIGGEHAVRLWDLRTRRELLTLAAPECFFLSLQFSPDGDGLLCGPNNCYLWRVPSFAELDAAQ